MENRYVVKFNGGLGNQMFQWAFARALEEKSGIKTFFDMSFFDKKYARPFELGVFGLVPKKISGFFDKLKLSIIWKLRKKLKNKKLLGLSFYSEPHFEYDLRLLNLNPNTYIEGFFQTEKYFKGIEDILRRDFCFNSDLDDLNKEVAGKIASTNSVSLHIRRGDYVQKKRYQKVYSTCSIEYYKNAVELIAQKYSNPTLFIFSDDIDWVKENLNVPYECVYVEHNTGAKSFEDMRLMSLCKHNVIANSSFSWWGAWLNSNPEKIVVAPQKWFRDEKIVQTDVIPESWTRIDN